MYHTLVPFVLSFLLSFPTSSEAQAKDSKVARCYYPDGRLRTSLDYRPCNNVVGQHSMCCALANRGAGADLCLPNGLCSAFTSDGSQTALWREGCTDPTWKSPACLKICMIASEEYNWTRWDAPITVCRDGTICCGNKEEHGGVCCKEKKGVHIAPTLLADVDTPTTTPKSSLRPTSADKTISVFTETLTTSIPEASTIDPISTNGPVSTFNSIQENATTSPEASSTSTNQAVSTPAGMTDTMKIAIGIGVPLLIALIVLAVFLVRWWTRRAIKKHAASHPPAPYVDKTFLSPGVVEIDPGQMIYEPQPKFEGYNYAYHQNVPAAPRHHVNVHELH